MISNSSASPDNLSSLRNFALVYFNSDIELNELTTNNKTYCFDEIEERYKWCPVEKEFWDGTGKLTFSMVLSLSLTQQES